MILSIAIILSNFINLNQALLGFDCSTTTTPNITTYSLLNPGECEFHNPIPESTNVEIELLQIVEFKTINTIQCKIKIHRTAYHCGVFGHLIPAETGEQDYMYEIDHEKCRSIHETGIFKYDEVHIIAGLKVNDTVTKGVDFAGSASGNTCTGSAYADTFSCYVNVFVQGTITIQLFKDKAQVNLEQDKILLSTGTACKFSDGHCLDLER